MEILSETFYAVCVPRPVVESRSQVPAGFPDDTCNKFSAFLLLVCILYYFLIFVFIWATSSNERFAFLVARHCALHCFVIFIFMLLHSWLNKLIDWLIVSWTSYTEANTILLTFLKSPTVVTKVPEKVIWCPSDARKHLDGGSFPVL